MVMYVTLTSRLRQQLHQTESIIGSINLLSKIFSDLQSVYSYLTLLPYIHLFQRILQPSRYIFRPGYNYLLIIKLIFFASQIN